MSGTVHTPSKSPKRGLDDASTSPRQILPWNAGQDTNMVSKSPTASPDRNSSPSQLAKAVTNLQQKIQILSTENRTLRAALTASHTRELQMSALLRSLTSSSSDEAQVAAWQKEREAALENRQALGIA